MECHSSYGIVKSSDLFERHKVGLVVISELCHIENENVGLFALVAYLGLVIYACDLTVRGLCRTEGFYLGALKSDEEGIVQICVKFDVSVSLYGAVGDVLDLSADGVVKLGSIFALDLYIESSRMNNVSKVIMLSVCNKEPLVSSVFSHLIDVVVCVFAV